MNLIATLAFTIVASALFTGEVLVAAQQQVLVIMPSQAFLRLQGGRMVRVGSYLSETALPCMALRRAGYSLTVATPQGNLPTMDPESNKSSYFANETEYQAALDFWYNDTAMQYPVALGEFALEEPGVENNATTNEQVLSFYSAVFVPGGHSPIIDIMSSTAVGRVLTYMWDNNKIIAAVCHGPLALASASLVRQPWIFAGLNMTVFSTAEEKIAEHVKWNNTLLGFYPPDVLRALGGKTKETKPWSTNVVRDGNLLTGQNPQSAGALGEAIVQALSA